MKLTILKESIMYDGSQISPLWGLRKGIKGDSVIVFHGPMDVEFDNMKDLEDEKARKAIKGDDLVHFIVERFDSPASMRLAYYMQRLLIACVKEVLREYGIETIRNGDDLYIDSRKLTVSIASAGISGEKIHCGINITTSGTPPDISTCALIDLGIKDWEQLAKDIAELFIKDVEDIEGDIAKTKGL